MSESFYIVTATIIPVLLLSTALASVIDYPSLTKRDRAKARLTMRLIIFVNGTAVLSLFRCMSVLLIDLQDRPLWEGVLIYSQLGLLVAINTGALLVPYVGKLAELKDPKPKSRPTSRWKPPVRRKRRKPGRLLAVRGARKSGPGSM